MRSRPKKAARTPRRSATRTSRNSRTSTRSTISRSATSRRASIRQPSIPRPARPTCATRFRSRASARSRSPATRRRTTTSSAANCVCKPGMLVTDSGVRNDYNRLNNLGFLRKGRRNVKPRPRSRRSRPTSRLKWTVKEQRTGTAQIGAGYSGGLTGTGLTGNISYSQNNINGTGNGASIRFEKGTQVGDAQLSFTVPYLGNTEELEQIQPRRDDLHAGADQLLSGLSGYARARRRGSLRRRFRPARTIPVSIVPVDPTNYVLESSVAATYKTASTGFSVSLGRRLSDYVRASLGANIQSVQASASVPAPYFFPSGAEPQPAGAGDRQPTRRYDQRVDGDRHHRAVDRANQFDPAVRAAQPGVRCGCRHAGRHSEPAHGLVHVASPTRSRARPRVGVQLFADHVRRRTVLPGAQTLDVRRPLQATASPTARSRSTNSTRSPISSCAATPTRSTAPNIALVQAELRYPVTRRPQGFGRVLRRRRCDPHRRRDAAQQRQLDDRPQRVHLARRRRHRRALRRSATRFADPAARFRQGIARHAHLVRHRPGLLMTTNAFRIARRTAAVAGLAFVLALAPRRPWPTGRPTSASWIKPRSRRSRHSPRPSARSTPTAPTCRSKYVARARGASPAEQQRLAREFQQKIADKQRQVLGPLFARAQVAIASVASSKNLSIVVDKQIVIVGGEDITGAGARSADRRRRTGAAGQHAAAVDRRLRRSEPRSTRCRRSKRRPADFQKFKATQDQAAAAKFKSAKTQADRDAIMKDYQKTLGDKQTQTLKPLVDKTRARCRASRRSAG